MTVGTIFNIQRFSVHDGPGIRTTVFLKGCPLACLWCHNPESQDPRPEVLFDAGKCIHCGSCLEACPVAEGPFAPPHRACLRCGACAEACPAEARSLAGRRVEAGELLAEAARDRVFFEESGGGLTFSGGEPLAQPEFMEELLLGCRELGLASALDTCGFAERGTFLHLAGLADLVLFDLKGMSEAAHLDRTGCSLGPILANLEALSTVHPDVRIRVPMVPGYTDNPEELGRMAAFLASLRRLNRVHLIPYHGLGAAKLRRMGRSPTREAASPEPEALRRAAGFFEDRGLNVRIGG